MGAGRAHFSLHRYVVGQDSGVNPESDNESRAHVATMGSFVGGPHINYLSQTILPESR